MHAAGGQHAVDGERTMYLDPTSDAGRDLRPLDPDLYDQLRSMATKSGKPASAHEACGVLPKDTVCVDRAPSLDDLIRNDRAARQIHQERCFHEAMVAVTPCSLVFLDSDCGLGDDTDPSRPTSDQRIDNASDDVSLEEIGRLLERGQSVVTHHLAGSSCPLTDQVEARMADVYEHLRAEPLAAVRGSRGATHLFTVIPHLGHRSDFQDRVGALQLSRWGDEFRVHRWRRELLTA